LLVGFNSHLHELRFRFSGFSGFNDTSMIFLQLLQNAKLCDHAFPRHDQEPQWVVIKCGFLNQFLIDRGLLGSDDVIGILDFNGIVFLPNIF
jgi:hypothetical protein